MTGHGYESWFRSTKGLIPDLQVGAHLRIEARTNLECGCPEEEWLFDGCAPLQIHFEEDGSAEAVLCFFEDFDLGQTFHGLTSTEDLRSAAFSWANGCLGGEITGERL
jgi:hypothetical protein